MNESFVEFFVDDSKIRNYEKSKCSWSSCGEYLAISALNNNKAGTLIFYDHENRLIEQAPNTSTDFLCKTIIIFLGLITESQFDQLSEIDFPIFPRISLSYQSERAD